ATAEAQFPLPLVPPDFGLKGAVFADAGVLYGLDVPAACAAPPCTIVGANDTAIRTSVGGSILWASPFGLLRVDFARALSKHRYPFLMVDRIVDVDGDNSAIGIKAVTVNEPHFIGHFPGRPVMPGVLLIEGIAQTAGAICSAIIGPRADGGPPLVYFMTVDQA